MNLLQNVQSEPTTRGRGTERKTQTHDLLLAEETPSREPIMRTAETGSVVTGGMMIIERGQDHETPTREEESAIGHGNGRIVIGILAEKETVTELAKTGM